MIIVTKNQYIIASKIHHISMDEIQDHNDIYVNGKRRSNINLRYDINVLYETSNPSTPTSLNRSPDYRECRITIQGIADAHAVFRDMVEQIRDQMPDELYLDKAIEKMLSKVDNNVLNKKQEEQVKEMDFTGGMDYEVKRRTKKVRKSGKAKRRSKKVLRRSK